MSVDGRLHGNVALVTGAGRGIGRATAIALARDGAAVAVNDVDEDAAEDTVRYLRSLGVRSTVAAGSIDDAVTCDEIVAVTSAALGPVDIVVDNAGIGSSGRSVHRTDVDEVARLFRTLAVGPFALCRSVLPAMRRRGSGSIVMISSQATLHHPPHGAPYAMGKAALEALAMTLANENRDHGVRINVVAPGLVDTRLGRMVLDRLANDAKGVARGGIPAAVLEPEDVAATVRYLVSPDAIGVTGQRIGVDLGRAATAASQDQPGGRT